MILSDEGKVFACICIALFIFIITALLLGEERKSKWFQKRKTYSFFLRRGLLGEWLHFGYPCTVSYWPIFLYYMRLFLEHFAANKECIP